MTNEDFKQQNKQLLAREKKARADGEFCSIVTWMKKSATTPLDFLLSLEDSDLNLENWNEEIYCRIKIGSIENIRWVRSNLSSLWIELQFELESENYRLIFWSPSSFRRQRIPAGNPGIFIWWLRMARHLAPMRQANFAEAERWRDVFPDAEFPDTKIKNAKS